MLPHRRGLSISVGWGGGGGGQGARLNREGVFFELGKMMVSILHKDLERKVETLKHIKLEVSAVEDPQQNPNF